jgi:hypothetical protein
MLMLNPTPRMSSAMPAPIAAETEPGSRRWFLTTAPNLIQIQSMPSVPKPAAAMPRSRELGQSARHCTGRTGNCQDRDKAGKEDRNATKVVIYPETDHEQDVGARRRSHKRGHNARHRYGAKVHVPKRCHTRARAEAIMRPFGVTGLSMMV